MILKHIKVDTYPGPEQMYPGTWWEANEIIGAQAQIIASTLATGGTPYIWRI